MKKLVSMLVLFVVVGLSHEAHALGWVCTSGSTPIKLDKVQVSGHSTTPTWSGSTLGDSPLGCTNNWTFYFTYDLTVPGSKEAYSLALSAFLSGFNVCLNVVSCNGPSNQPIVDSIQINR